MVVPAAIRRELERHADEEAPNEACGLLALREGVAERYIPCINAAASPYRFDLRVPDPELIFEVEEHGYELAVFHSHPTDSARPSKTDLANIGLWEDAAVPDPLATDRRALRVDDSRGSRRAAPPRFPG